MFKKLILTKKYTLKNKKGVYICILYLISKIMKVKKKKEKTILENISKTVVTLGNLVSYL